LSRTKVRLSSIKVALNRIKKYANYSAHQYFLIASSFSRGNIKKYSIGFSQKVRYFG
jgi:hypothetical protein